MNPETRVLKLKLAKALYLGDCPPPADNHAI